MGGTVKAPQSPHDPWVSPRYGTLSLNMNLPMPPFAASLDSPRAMTAPGSPRPIASRGRVAQPTGVPPCPHCAVTLLDATGWGGAPVWDGRHHLLMSTVDRDASRIVRHNSASTRKNFNLSNTTIYSPRARLIGTQDQRLRNRLTVPDIHRGLTWGDVGS